ncbi:cytochrome-c peroxidase [Caulobacter sp. KR2-114]|uniref:cytochrome-c peroxidase n=1 Tax=Caulobacter sp. KR2-114 TaxID=3400912 RepID=UPI003C0BD3A6
MRRPAAAGLLALIAGAALAAAAVAGGAGRADRVELGRQLFYDADLSRDGTMACATCHEQRRGFTDGNATHPGVTGAPARRRVMRLANLGHLASYTRGDPRLGRLEAQALVPLNGDHPVEMGARPGLIAARLGADACYRRAFARAFPGEPGGVTDAKAIRALAAFERTLVSADTAWDRARRGDPAALSDAARRGEALFRGPRLACAGCHAGPDFTDAAAPAARRDPSIAFHAIGLPASATDQGLGEITGRAADGGRFRTPSLRNVALSAPYLHDGSVPTLEAAIRAHTRASPAVAGLTTADLADLVAFLNALTDQTLIADPRLALPKHQCGR